MPLNASRHKSAMTARNIATSAEVSGMWRTNSDSVPKDAEEMSILSLGFIYSPFMGRNGIANGGFVGLKGDLSPFNTTPTDFA